MPSAKPFEATPNSYQREAHKTATYDHGVDDISASHNHRRNKQLLRLAYVLTGLGGEVGELQQLYSKIIRDSSGEMYEADRDRMISELGDVLWFVTETATVLDIPLSEVMQRNLEKLRDRADRNVISGSGDNR